VSGINILSSQYEFTMKHIFNLYVKKQSSPRYRPWRPIELQDVEDPTLSRLSGKVVSPTNRPHSTPQKHYFYVSGTHFC
jgi:hypothetical protein